MSRTAQTADRQPPRRARTVSRLHDPAERQADRAADVVARGGSVGGWSFGSVPVEAGVHRDDAGVPKSNEDKLKDAAVKAGEAALETTAGKALQQKVKDDPLVKGATKFLDTTPGKVVAGGVIAAGIGGLAAAKQPLPFQAPAIPLDRITPGLSAKVTVEGPLDAPTFVGLSITYKEQGPKGKGGPTEKDRIAADTARLRAQQEMFKPQAQRDREKADEDAAVARILAAQSRRFGVSTLIPVGPSTAPRTVDAPREDAPPDAAKKEEGAEPPVQRAPVSEAVPETATGAAPAVVDAGVVDGALRGGGRPLDPATRRSMEARFGYDFGSVRVHDDAAATGAAAALEARAFTVGEHIVFGGGGPGTSTPDGRHLLAHELAHVAQGRGRGPGSVAVPLRRRSVFESIGILLGLEEGTWSDRELHAYLDAITASGKIDGSYDADNKARAIVRRWKAASPGFDLLGPQKSLLIDEMLDGPTGDEDEGAILDLLELSDASDLRAIFADAKGRMARLDADIDGDEHKRLDAFIARRFKGGRPELQAGRVVVLGPPVPAGAPAYGFDAAMFDARLDTDRTEAELIALFDRFTPDDRRKAVDHLLHEVWPRAKEEVGRGQAESVADGVTADDKKAIAERIRPAFLRARKAERILEHAFLADIPATAEALKGGTRPMDPAQASELRTVLRPRQFAAAAKADEAVIELDEPEPAKTAGKTSGKTAGKAAGKAPAKPGTVGFHDPDKYRAEIETALPGIIDDYYKRHVTEAGPRAKMDEVEAMAEVAKRETDAVFGAFYDTSKHPELRGDRKGAPGNLHFWYDTADRELRAMSTAQRRALATSWLLYYFQSDTTIRLLNDKYSAAPEFDEHDVPHNAEATLLASIAKKVTGNPKDGHDTVRKLVETRRGWGGMASGRQVFVDLFHDADTDKDRLACWDLFQTLIHEYLHTLADDRYETYAKTFGASSVEWNTLIEGVDCVLDEVVWAHVVPRVTDPALRKVIEGEAHAKLPPIDIPPPGRYPSYQEALRLVGLVGIQNVYAAYFLGLVDRVSAPKGAAAKAAKPKGPTP